MKTPLPLPWKPWSTEVEGAAGFYQVAGGGGTALNVVANVGIGGFDRYANGNCLSIRRPGTEHRGCGGRPDHDRFRRGRPVDADRIIKSGGAVGDDNVVFAVQRKVTSPATDRVTLELANLGVAPGRAGTITMTVSESTGSPHRASFAGAVTAVKGLMPSGKNINPTATVASGFLSFDTGQTATVGMFNIMPVTGVLLHAGDWRQRCQP